jgi:hypothetical protein
VPDIGRQLAELPDEGADLVVLIAHGAHGVAVLEHPLELGVEAALGGVDVRQQGPVEELVQRPDLAPGVVRVFGEQRVGHLRHPVDVGEDPLVVLVGHLRQGVRHGWTSLGSVASATKNSATGR